MFVATKAHRVWVVDERMHAVGVVSLTDILSVIARSGILFIFIYELDK